MGLVSIHAEHPFATPPEQRDAVRRFRGRLCAPVTLWASGRGAARVGLTVSSLMVALGEPARIVGLLDPDSEFALGLGGRGTVTLLAPPDQHLAEVFAGLAPSPGGPFRSGDFRQGEWGPFLPDRSWIGVTWEDSRRLGWSTEVTGVIEHVSLADGPTLAHVRGRYRAEPAASGRGDTLGPS